MWIGQTPVNDENKNNNNNNNKFNRFSLNYVIIITIILSLYSDITVFLCTSLYGECDYPSVVGFPFNVNGLFFILLFPRNHQKFHRKKINEQLIMINKIRMK